MEAHQTCTLPLSHSFPPPRTYVIDMGGYLSTAIIRAGIVNVDPDAGLIETLPSQLDWMTCPIDLSHRNWPSCGHRACGPCWVKILDIPSGYETWEEDNRRMVPECPFCGVETQTRPIPLRFALQEALEQAGRVTGKELWRVFEDQEWRGVSRWWTGRR